MCCTLRPLGPPLGSRRFPPVAALPLQMSMDDGVNKSKKKKTRGRTMWSVVYFEPDGLQCGVVAPWESLHCTVRFEANDGHPTSSLFREFSKFKLSICFETSCARVSVHCMCFVNVYILEYDEYCKMFDSRCYSDTIYRANVLKHLFFSCLFLFCALADLALMRWPTLNCKVYRVKVCRDYYASEQKWPRKVPRKSATIPDTREREKGGGPVRDSLGGV